MTDETPCIYEFDAYRLNLAERQLTRVGEPVDLTPKVYDLLALLVRNAGRLLEKDELLQALWPDTVVEEVNLNVNVSGLRKALGESPSAPRFIETVPKRGYRFIAAVTTGAIDEAPLPVAPAPAAVRAPRLAPWMLGALLLVTLASGGFWWWWFRDRAEAARPRTIAVLPFRPLTAESGDEREQALGLGMADALIVRLGSLQHLTVRSTGAVQKYANQPIDPVAAGRELGVDSVLEGRLQREGHAIRVTARLVRVADGAALWTGKFDDAFTNVFALQDSLSERMTEALSMHLTEQEHAQMTRRFTENAEAYQLYSQGRYQLFKYHYEKALDFFRASAARDPNYPLAYTGLAMNYIALAVTTPRRPEMLAQAVTAARKALSLDPLLDEAYNALGFVKFLGDWDWAGAEQDLRRALELNPNNADARQNYADLLAVLGRFPEALREAARARDLNPVSNEIAYSVALTHFYARRYEAAEDACRKLLAADPQNPSGLQVRFHLDLAQGRYEQALAEIQRLQQGGNAPPGFLSFYAALAHARLGHRAEAEAFLRDLALQSEGAGRFQMCAMVAAALGDRDRAFAFLEKAFDARDNQMIHLRVDPEWDPLRADPRFAALLRRMKLSV